MRWSRASWCDGGLVVFWYSPGTGFEHGRIVYSGRSQYRSIEDSQYAREQWENRMNKLSEGGAS